MNKRKLGAQKECLAAEYLRSQGMQILEQNFRCRIGEIDVVARDGDTLVFAEVKYRKNDHYGSPLEAVNFHKQNTIRKVAEYYLMCNPMVRMTVRFDVIGILGDKIEHIRNAF